MPKRYQNLDEVGTNKTLVEIWKCLRERWSKSKDLSIHIPRADERNVEELKKNRTKTSYTWIGHSSFLLQMKGLNILTDPVFAKYLGFSKRLISPGLSIDELPEIDIVVISHGHYDHLEFSTLRSLKGEPIFYVPAGLNLLFQKKGLHRVEEANWWDTFQHQDLTIHFVPAQHWTRRSLFDTNTSHWGGWVLESDEETNYFVGDTGYFRGFQEIGKKFALDTVFMPIGSYEPEWFTYASHINPEDAVKAFVELQAKTFVPMHYGTYRLADDTGPEALARLLHEWKRCQLPEHQLFVMKVGETVFKK
ncbi:MBL fold metallo-hydrolase [Halalkalibacterium halodurans]|uniref:BH3116 protein n=2 Tax=Halalkalibacterium halodurans TaxID=86665 RepID=Q9K890_HALH5|nr:MBL fold metallo-hydrolase [Halalkalibacterium halodurans]MED4082099.1 MBL fold metallo-hydrolase [Halalkalibacterium halodurans]MED4084323.1 MBL fold metallo-hydrolase [Halalkalibacterium halodurans]MED4103632.1 MBL fold metallo-hydrolase [Halalkalibacterium halodurans]MED4107599.1 MBL fold metallo-hydrolase [Halalkalibacterium halodurans]MED4126020.1 MBL fold metallo-hydrolase [Halalkalibacterium halodurans]